jgi:dihydroorotase-like cyclic amidohydrolase
VEALWGHIATGGLDIVSSDHVGWQTSLKDRDDIFAVAAGFPTVELTLPLLFSEGVVRRGLPLARLVEVVCEAPARRYGLQQHKGSITIGSDADLVVFDSEASWRITNSDMVAAAGWSPYNGREVTGRVVTTLLRGKPVFIDGHPTGAPGGGRFIQPTDRA